MNAPVLKVFSSPRRLWMTVGTTIIVIFVIMAMVLAVRINQALDVAPTASPTATGDGLPVLPDVDVSPSLTTRDQEFLDTPTADPFADLGDPRPVVLSAVEAWRSMDVEAMQKAYLPAALDEVVSTPPGTGFRVTGEIEVTKPGPTRSVLTLPTNVRLLEIVVVGVDGRWMIESIGYR
jgi:hypothetical protein